MTTINFTVATANPITFGVSQQAITFNVGYHYVGNGVGLPSGGLVGQAVIKQVGNDYAVGWEDGPWIKWMGDWAPGTYKLNQQALDAGYLGIVNTASTEDRLAPQAVGGKAWTLSDTPTWTDIAATDTITYGVQISNLTKAYQISDIRIWIPNLSATASYQLYKKDNVTEVVTLGTKYTGDLFPLIGWHSIAIDDTFLTPGMDVTIGVIATNSSADTTFNHPWEWGGSINQEVDPGVGNVNRRGDNSVLRINETDDDATSRISELAQAIPGSIIRVADEANLSSYMEYEVLDATDEGTWYTYTVALVDIGAAGEPPAAARCQVYFTIPIATPTDYVTLTNEYSGNATLQGVLKIGNGAVTTNDDAHGIDIMYQEYQVSPDWDIVGILNGSGGGGSNTVIEDLLTSTNTDTALSSNQGRVLDERLTIVSDDLGIAELDIAALELDVAALEDGSTQTIFVPATAMTPRSINGAEVGSVAMSSTDRMLETLDFDTATTEAAQFAVQMPKSWDGGTITAQFIWSHAATTTNFGVRFFLKGAAIADGDAGDTAWGSGGAHTADNGGTTDDIYITGKTVTIIIGNTPAKSEWVSFQIHRAVGDAGDTLAVDARLHGVSIFYTTDTYTDA